MKTYRQYRESETENPDFSITHVRGATFNVFRESDGTDLGNHHRENIQSYGFAKSDLDFVKKTGTTNFIRVEGVDNE